MQKKPVIHVSGVERGQARLRTDSREREMYRKGGSVKSIGLGVRTYRRPGVPMMEG
jgi:hypothetical protein